MLVIRPEQMEAFEQAALRNFEQRAAEHLRETFPKHARFLGEGGVRDVVRHGLEKARGYGFSSERGFLLYLELMLLVGGGFDEDPQLPWAAQVLSSQSSAEPERLEALRARAAEYFERVAGAKGEHIDRALEKLRQTPVEGFRQSGGSDFATYMRTRLQMLYPEKCAGLGEEGVRALIRQGVEFARSHRLTTERGVVTSTVLMFFLGSGFASDPQFPWAAAILDDPALTDPPARADRLYAAAKDFLERWLA